MRKLEGKVNFESSEDLRLPNYGRTQVNNEASALLDLVRFEAIRWRNGEPNERHSQRIDSKHIRRRFPFAVSSMPLGQKPNFGSNSVN